LPRRGRGASPVQTPPSPAALSEEEDGVGAPALAPGCGDDAICAGGDTCICESDCDKECDGASCQYKCEQGAACTFKCADGGCTVQCNSAKSCELDCPGNNCQLECSGTPICKLTGCSTGCPLNCGGAATCSNSCDLTANCPTQK
jgi:hypothetical protein